MKLEWQGDFLYEVTFDDMRMRHSYVLAAISEPDFAREEWLSTHWHDNRRTTPVNTNIPLHLTKEEARKYVEALVRLTLSPRS